MDHLIYGSDDGQQAASGAFVVNAGKAKTVCKGPTNMFNRGSFFRWPTGSSELHRLIGRTLRYLKRALKASYVNRKVCEKIILLFGVQGVLTRDIFCGLDDTDSGFRTVCKEAFEVDTDKGFTHTELNSACIACTAARVHSDATTGVDAIQNPR